MCLVVASLDAEASWGHNFARQSRVRGICRVLCVMLPIVLYRCRRLLIRIRTFEKDDSSFDE